MSYGRLVKSWDGHTTINDEVTYSAIFIDGNSIDALKSSATEASRVGNTPLHVRVQPDGLTFLLLVSIEGDMTQAKLNQLKAWFNTKRGERRLVATDQYGSGVDEHIKCAVTGFMSQSTPFVLIELRAAEGVWQQVTGETDDQNVGEGGGEVLDWTLDNDGTDDTPMIVTVTASAPKDSADSYTKRRWLSIANRTEDEVDDPDSDGYPVMIADLTALSITPGDDVRVFNGGLELRRWIDASDRVWVNLHLRPRKVATLAANINDSVTALEVDNTEGFDRDNWYESGFFKIDNETIQYTDRDVFDAGTLVRGARGSTAASHTAGTSIYWVEHDYLYMLYDFDTPPALPLGDDHEPLIDMDNSSNDEHQWADEFYNDIGGRRSRGWQRRSIDQGDADEHVRQYADSGAGTFENNLPAAGKPALNNAVMRFPVPLVGPFEEDLDVNLEMAMRALVQDSEGYESRLFQQGYTATPLTGDSHALPGNVRQLRFNGRMAGIFGDLDDGAADIATGTAIGPAPKRTLLRFELDVDTPLNAVVAHHAISGGGATFMLIERSTSLTDVGGREFEYGTYTEVIVALQATLPDTTPDWVVYVPYPGGIDNPVYLPAGVYWLALTEGVIYSYHSRTLARSYIEEVDEGTDPTSITQFHDRTAVFAIVSFDATPQADAPFDSGHLIQFSNVVAPLDSTRSPKVDVGTEDDVYLLDETLSNDTTDETLSLFFPLSIDQDIEVDTGQRLITDIETGQLVPWARAASTSRWPHLTPGTNNISWSGTGVTGLVVRTSWSPLRL